MNPFKNYYKRIIRQDFVNKCKTNHSEKLPNPEKITLNFGCKGFTLTKFATTTLALEVIAKKKASITTSKKPNVLLNIQKGQPVGNKIELKKNRTYLFINNLLVLTQFKNFSGFRIKDRSISYQLPKNAIKLQELEAQYPLFSELPVLDITIFANSKGNSRLVFFTKSIKLI